MPLYTVGHGTLSQEQLTALLQGAGIEMVVDVRTAPGSRRHPHVSRQRLAQWLVEAGIDYRWERDLGGWRRPADGSPNVALRHPAFRGYADHMAEPSFWQAVDRLLVSAAGHPTVAMCSESLWWKCHRRLVADAVVLARSVEVLHLASDGRLSPHTVTLGARLAGPNLLRYDVGRNQGLPLA